MTDHLSIDEEHRQARRSSGGIAKRIRKPLTSAIQTKSGSGAMSMPGARSLHIGHDDIEAGQDRSDTRRSTGPEPSNPCPDERNKPSH